MSVEERHQLAQQILEIFPLVMRSLAADMRQVSQLYHTAHFHLLWALEHRSYTLSELAEMRSVSLPTISNSITILEDRGWVRRVRSGEDRRKVAVEMTEAGQEMLNHIRQHNVHRVAEVIANLTSDDEAKISEGLLILRAAFLKSAQWDASCLPGQHITTNTIAEGEK